MAFKDIIPASAPGIESLQLLAEAIRQRPVAWFLYTLALLLAAVGIALLFPLDNSNAMLPLALYLAACLLLGGLHLWLFQVGKWPGSETTLSVALLFTFFLACNLTGVCAFILDRSGPAALVPGAAFLLPLTLFAAWQAWAGLHQKPLPWMLPASGSTQTVIFLHREAVELKVARKGEGIPELLFPLVAPVELPIGMVFYFFVQQLLKEEPHSFDTVDASGQPFAWEFSVSRWRGLHRFCLDPALSLEQQGIGRRQPIHIRRVRVGNVRMLKLAPPIAQQKDYV